MKVLVVGANGQIGQQLVQLLKGEEDYSPVAMVMSEEQAQKFADAGVETVLADLESSVHELVSAIKGHVMPLFLQQVQEAEQEQIKHCYLISMERSK